MVDLHVKSKMEVLGTYKQRVLKLDIKSMIHKRKIDKLDIFWIKILCSAKGYVKGIQLQTGRKGSQTIYLTKYLYLEYKKISPNSTVFEN